MDKATKKELLEFIQESILLIKKRFSAIQTSDDFLKDIKRIQSLTASHNAIQSKQFVFMKPVLLLGFLHNQTQPCCQL